MNMKKGLLLFFLALSLLLIQTTVMAQETGVISFASSKTEFAIGDDVAIEIRLNTGTRPITTWKAMVNYDPAVLELTAGNIVVNDATWDASPLPGTPSLESGKVTIGDGKQGQTGVTSDDVLLATLTFSALAEGSVTFSFDTTDPNNTYAKYFDLDTFTIKDALATYSTLDITVGGSSWEPIQFGFDADAEGWTFSGAVGTFTQPTGEYDAGFLKLQAADNTNTFGFWSSAADAIGMLDNAFLYRARFGVKSDQADKALVPTFRCRWNLSNKAQGDTLMVNSKVNGEASPDTTVQDYDLYFQPQGDLTGLTGTLAMDIINMDDGDAATGAIYADYINVDRIDMPEVNDPSAVSYDFTEGNEGWTDSGEVGDFTEPVFASIAGTLTMTCADNNTFGYWQNPQDAIALANDKLYVLKVTAGSAAVAAGLEAPLMRIRMYDHPSNQMCYMFQIPILTKYIEGTGALDADPMVDYYGYFVDSLGVGPNLGIAIDIVNLDPSMDPNGVVSIDAVELSAIDIPSF